MHIIPMEYSGLSVGIPMMATIMDGLTGNILPFIPAPSKMSPPPAVLQLRLRVFPLEKDKLPETVFMAMLPVMPAIQTGHRQHSTKSKMLGTSPQRIPVLPMA